MNRFACFLMGLLCGAIGVIMAAKEWTRRRAIEQDGTILRIA